LWAQLDSYLSENLRMWLRKSTLIESRKRNTKNLIPLYCHVPVSCRNIVEGYEFLGSWKLQIKLFINL
jgi:hypothetical protein